MKTLKELQCQKVVIWSLVVMFSFLQIVPTGWAAVRPDDELQARGVSASVDPLANPAAPKPAPAPQRVVGFVDSTAFQLNSSPLSPASSEKSEKAVELPDPNDRGTKPVALEDKEAAALQTLDETYTGKITAPPSQTHVVTDPATGRELSVTLDKHGIATVKWGDQEYRGYFDPRTNSVILVTNDSTIWTLQFGNNDKGELYLQSFQTRQWTKLGYSEETYTFNQQGQLTRKDWLTENSGYFWPIYYTQKCASEKGGCFNPGPIRSYRSGGTIDYVTINGRTLVSHEKTWSETGKNYYYGLDYAEKTTLIGYIYPHGRSETESWYSYDSQGNLLAKNWNTNDGYGGSTFGQEQYVHINGRDLVSVRRVWQYNSLRKWIDEPIVGPILHRDENATIAESRIVMPFYSSSSYAIDFYQYDSQGNVIGELHVRETTGQNGERTTEAHYWLFDPTTSIWRWAAAKDLDASQIDSFEDYALIDQAASRRALYLGGSAGNRTFTHHIAYEKNAAGEFVAKEVFDNQTGTWSFVRGEPDILSGESDDMKFINGQEVNGYRVSYEKYPRLYATGEYAYDEFRVVFFGQNGDVTAVNFPSEDTIALNGVEYKITLDEQGLFHLVELNPTITPEVAAVRADLLKNLAIDEKQLDEWIKQGLIKITLDAERGLVTVSFGKALRDKFDGLRNLNLFDPASASGLPRSIEYHYITTVDLTNCNPGEVCAHNGTRHTFLDSAHITHWNGTRGVARYSSGILRQVDWYRSYRDGEIHPMIACQVGDFSCGMALDKTITYGLVVSIPEDHNPAHLRVTIVFHDPALKIRKLIFEIGMLADGKDHILKIREFDRDGKMLAVSEFKYLISENNVICVQGADCVPPPANVWLDSIIRKDANGKLLSTIHNIRPFVFDPRLAIGETDPTPVGPIYLWQYSADMSLPNGVSTRIYFNDLNGLLEQARERETASVIPPAVQAYVDQLQGALDARSSFYQVTAMRTDAGYQILVSLKGGENVLISADQLSGMSFTLSADGTFDKNSLQVNFGGISADAQLLYDAVLRLMLSNVQSGMGIEAPLSEQVLAELTMVKVNKAANSIIPPQPGLLIEYRGKGYRISRNADGTIHIDPVVAIPPAVQSFVDRLETVLGANYTATVTQSPEKILPPRYLVSVFYTPKVLRQGQLRSMVLNVNQDGSFVSFRQADFDNITGLDVQLLYDAMGVCPQGQVCTMQAIGPIGLLKKMTQIEVTKVENGAIFYTLAGTSYKAYRDTNGQVKVEVVESHTDLPVFTPAISKAITHPSLASWNESEEKSLLTTSGLADLPAMRWLDFSREYAPVAHTQGSYASIVRIPIMSSVSSLSNATGTAAVSSSKASHIFGFEQKNILFGDLMLELTR